MTDRDARLHEARRLLHRAVRGVTDLIEQSHDEVAGHVVRVAKRVGVGDEAQAIDDLRRLITQVSLLGVRATNTAVERVGDVAGAALRRNGDPTLVPLRSDAITSLAGAADAAIGALNGAIGDRLAAEGSALDLGMALRVGDALLGESPDVVAAQLEAAGARLDRPLAVVVLVHGLCATEWSFCFGAGDHWDDPSMHFGRRLRAELGLTPVFARYNSGRSIARNGAELAAALRALERRAAASGRPLQRLCLVGHSMGGLVLREAMALGLAQGEAWAGLVDAIACLGSPHQGAPLERIVASLTGALATVPWPAASVPAKLLSMRSDGICDLAHGDGNDDDDDDGPPGAKRWQQAIWPSRDGLRWLLLGASLPGSDDGLAAALVGDGMVSVASATAARRPAAASRQRVVVQGVSHAEIPNHPRVYAALATFLSKPAAA